jgi:hypothetical protein
MCGVLLLKQGHIAEAEDAILRNLDVNLESQQSLVALLAVYHVSHDTRKLVERLSKPAIARSIPAPLLLECVGVLGTGNIPPATLAQIVGSLRADVDHHFGPDDFRIETGPLWQLDRASMSLAIGGKTINTPNVSVESDKHKARFLQVGELGSLLQPAALPDSVVLTIKYPETETLKLHLQEVSARTLKSLTGEGDSAFRWPVLAGRDFRIVAVDVRGKRVQLLTPANPLPALPIEQPLAQPVSIPVEAPAPFTADDPQLPVVPAF